jgi:hypothetical protein
LSDNTGIKIELNSKRNCRHYMNKLKSNNIILNDQWVTEKVMMEIKKFLKSSDNGNTNYQNWLDTLEAVLM